MQQRNLLPALVVLAALGGPAQAQIQQKDWVYGRHGAPLRGRIAKVSPSEIAIDVDGGQKTVAVNETLKVTFGEDPPELKKARDEILRERYEDAKPQLDKISAEKATRAEVKQDILYYQAYCAAKLALAAGADKTAPGRMLQEFIRENPESYHYYEAVELFGDLAYSAGGYESAAKHYGLLAAAPWPEHQMRAALSGARAMIAQSQFKEALQQYENVLNNSLDTPEAARQKLFAVVGKSVCLAKTGQHEEGLKLVQRVIAENEPSDTQLFGRAYNAMGACYRQADRPKDALLAYLHVHLLFRGDPDIHAEALYHLSKLWTAVNRSDRAVQSRELLRSRYPGSLWADLLAKES